MSAPWPYRSRGVYLPARFREIAIGEHLCRVDPDEIYQRLRKMGASMEVADELAYFWRWDLWT